MEEDKLIFYYNDSPVKKHTLGEISDAVAKMALEKVFAAQQSVHLTLCGLWLFLDGS